MFVVRGRAAWGARPPRHAVYQAPRDVHTIVVHHTVGKPAYTRRAAIQELRAMQNFHMDQRGWSDIGYNFIIDRAGRVWEGRGYYRVGAHTANHNSGTIGVSFMGNYETIKPTLRQRLAFYALCRRLRNKGLRYRQIKGHRQMPGQSTSCPGRHLTAALNL